MAASGTIDGGPEPWPVHHCVLNDAQYTNHLLVWCFHSVFNNTLEFGQLLCGSGNPSLNHAGGILVTET